ncbi:unnamed protein product [Mytilus coruscus]|uniref:ShKT domain-containing protein n=1 Tax=Mytilus coruscus TaxID=42192 RepID=A0A6J8BQ86_MYTCO|nr:unnamed protein product [Mytilus coruscus]
MLLPIGKKTWTINRILRTDRKLEKLALSITLGPITAAQHCSDNKLVHCHHDGVCEDKILKVQCPVTCGLCQAPTNTSIPATSVPTTSATSIPTTPTSLGAQPCLDDAHVSCHTSVCNGALKQFCPATCKTCSAITSLAPCFDDPSINCHISACSHPVLKDFCKATCGLCSVTTSSKHTCNKLGLLMDLAFGLNINNTNARKCEGKSADAILLKHCSAPNIAAWTKGIQVSSICNKITPYSPIAEWKDNHLTDVSGVVVSCQNKRIEMISQSCGSPVSLRNITRPASDSLFTVLW